MAIRKGDCDAGILSPGVEKEKSADGKAGTVVIFFHPAGHLGAAVLLFETNGGIPTYQLWRYPDRWRIHHSFQRPGELSVDSDG